MIVRTHTAAMGMVAVLVAGMLVGCATVPQPREKDPSPCTTMHFYGTDQQAFEIAKQALGAIGVIPTGGSAEAGFAAGESQDGAHRGQIIGVYFRPASRGGLLVWVSRQSKIRWNPFAKDARVPLVKELQVRIREHHKALAAAEKEEGEAE